MMTDEHALLRERERAVRAKELLENPLLIETLDALDAAYVAEWRNSVPDAYGRRERIWMQLSVLHDFRAAFKHMVETGKFANAELEALARRDAKRG